MNAEVYISAWQHNAAWGVYLVAAAVFCLACWRLTRRWQPDIRLLLCALLAVFLFMPAPVAEHSVQAPAMIFVLMKPISGASDQLAPVLARLLLGTVAVIIVVLVAGIWRRRRHSDQEE